MFWAYQDQRFSCTKKEILEPWTCSEMTLTCFEVIWWLTEFYRLFVDRKYYLLEIIKSSFQNSGFTKFFDLGACSEFWRRHVDFKEEAMVLGGWGPSTPNWFRWFGSRRCSNEANLGAVQVRRTSVSSIRPRKKYFENCSSLKIEI